MVEKILNHNHEPDSEKNLMREKVMNGYKSQAIIGHRFPCGMQNRMRKIFCDTQRGMCKIFHDTQRGMRKILGGCKLEYVKFFL